MQPKKASVWPMNALTLLVPAPGEIPMAESSPILRMAQTIDRRARFPLSIPWYIYFETANREKNRKKSRSLAAAVSKILIFLGNFLSPKT